MSLSDILSSSSFANFVGWLFFKTFVFFLLSFGFSTSIGRVYLIVLIAKAIRLLSIFESTLRWEISMLCFFASVSMISMFSMIFVSFVGFATSFGGFVFWAAVGVLGLGFLSLGFAALIVYCAG